MLSPRSRSGRKPSGAVGIPINQVATWLGHTNPNTTLKTYAPVLGEAQDIAALKHLNTLEPGARG